MPGLTSRGEGPCWLVRERAIDQDVPDARLSGWSASFAWGSWREPQELAIVAVG
jgi:hypothetical protein